jgi:DNA-binding transcriptional regulator YiaG
MSAFRSRAAVAARPTGGQEAASGGPNANQERDMVKKTDGAGATETAPAANGPMTPEAFRAWRKRLGLKQKEAADQLGLKKRMIQYYEKGRRDEKAVEIPKTVRLACFALSSGVVDFDGERAQPRPTAAADEAGTAAANEA